MYLAAETLRLKRSLVDFLLMAIYFTFVLGIGFALKRAVRSSLDFFLSGRSLPAWITGIAFAAGAIAMALASLPEKRKTDDELHGLVYGLEIRDASETVTYPW